MNCGYTESTAIVSLLLGLLWYIGGSPPVLRGILLKYHSTCGRTLRKTVNLLQCLKTFQCVFLMMCITDLVYGAKLNGFHSTSSSPDHSWCGMSLVEQVEGADIVARASVVSRSRVEKGHYYATFRIDKLLHSSDVDLMAKFLRLKLETKSHRRKTSSSQCNFSTKVKPNNKYLVMVKKQGQKKQAGIFANADHFSLFSPPLKSTKKLMREVKSILCDDCREEHEQSQRVRVRRGKGVQKEAQSVIEEGKVRKRRVNKRTTRLSCSAKGNPPPTLYWTMDGKVIENSPTTKIVTKNLSKFLRKSTLKLKQSVSKRPVHLQCHAYNSYGHTSKVTVTKRKKSEENKSTENSRKRKSNSRLNAFRKSASGIKSAPLLDKHVGGLMGELMRSRPLGVDLPNVPLPKQSPLYSTGCPIPDYCMNGGTCQFYSTIGEQTCHCAKGFHGRRCERKYVSTGNFGPRMSDKFPMCLLGMAHYPCQ